MDLRESSAGRGALSVTQDNGSEAGLRLQPRDLIHGPPKLGPQGTRNLTGLNPNGMGRWYQRKYQLLNHSQIRRFALL
jgi:hypothetical protein